MVLANNPGKHDEFRTQFQLLSDDDCNILESAEKALNGFGMHPENTVFTSDICRHTTKILSMIVPADRLDYNWVDDISSSVQVNLKRCSVACEEALRLGKTLKGKVTAEALAGWMDCLIVCLIAQLLPSPK